MKRCYQFLIAVLLITSLSGFCARASALHGGGVNPDNYQRLVITLLYDGIREAISDFYGGAPRGYDLYDAKVTKLESAGGWSRFDVTVEVESFYGPHNPPYALEIMTFHVTLGQDPELTGYEHRDLE
ncbi:DUF3888 domain-containing protein [Papillibacter cinnamivorans]|uniref:DUF3888 domain-containing protein n=1 Tax=Papillibacter cinnamivorans DSM 12816 TaxID=1122930 RepID=A0A1W2C181_9FIRM|nr:DUF3888 domain-containing protein [Papillibacter cinnamivorans]SMC78939.1 Protein of unknown function [Papillibacter cinnamivorans DSM 12816]